MNLHSVVARASAIRRELAGPEEDLDAANTAKLIWIAVQKSAKAHIGMKLVKNPHSDTVWYYQAVPDADKQPYPSGLYGHHNFIAQLSSIIPNAKDKLVIVLATAPRLSKQPAGGVFYRQGIWGQATIVIYMHRMSPEMTTWNSTQLDNFIGVMRHYETIFVHEYQHFLDSIRTNNKGIKGVQPGANNENQKNYINDTAEINARYAEGIASILYSINALVSVKREGLKGRFPTFASFWGYFKSSFPSDLRQHATPATLQRIIKRTAKLYEFLCHLATLPKDNGSIQRLKADALNPLTIHRYEWLWKNARCWARWTDGHYYPCTILNVEYRSGQLMIDVRADDTDEYTVTPLMVKPMKD